MRSEEMGADGQMSAATGAGDRSGELVSDAVERWGTRLILAYFGLRLLFLALSISSFVPPDEVTHAGLCKVFSRVLLMPENGPDTYQFGLVTNVPWLYYWTFGKLLHLNFFGLSDLVFLRLLNIPLAFGTVLYGRRLVGLLTRDRLTGLLFLVVATNVAMFTLMSASVSYDNLTNLLAVMAIYYQFAFFRYRSGGLLAGSLLCQLLGALTKISYLPLIIALNAILLIHELKVRDLPSVLAAYFRHSRRRAVLLLLALAVAFGLNLQLYGGNYRHYGTPIPAMSMVLSQSTAMNSRTDARGIIFNEFKDGKISYMDAVILAGEIKHPGDKADTFYLLMNYQKMKLHPELWMGPAAYGVVWFKTMLGGMIGIRAHLSMLKPPIYLVPFYLLVALALAGFIVRWRPGGSRWLPPSLAVISLFYAGFLIYKVNYDTYLNYGDPGLTVYGRYLFPIIFPVYALICHYLLQLFRGNGVRLGLAVATALIFVCYDFPWFLAHSTPEWFSWLPQ